VLDQIHKRSQPITPFSIMITKFAIALVAVLFLAPGTASFGAEHPSGPGIKMPPTNTSASTQPANQSRQVTAGDISAGIKRNIGSERKKASDKKFHVKYRDKDLALDLVKVHDEAVSSLGGARYFACVDMKAADGTNYDIDFFMAGQPGAMRVTEASVHKINGKPLYNWKETDGVWKKVAGKGS
jgi:hypothetical protein